MAVYNCNLYLTMWFLFCYIYKHFSYYITAVEKKKKGQRKDANYFLITNKFFFSLIFLLHIKPITGLCVFILSAQNDVAHFLELLQKKHFVILVFLLFRRLPANLFVTAQHAPNHTLKFKNRPVVIKCSIYTTFFYHI